MLIKCFLICLICFWNKDDKNILDPCAGFGNFEIYLKAKHPSFLKNLYANEILKHRFLLLKNNFNGSNLFNDDAFNLFEKFQKEGLFFDLIVANPPYASKNKNRALSNRFIESSIDVLKDDGYLLFIVPCNFISFNNNNTTLKKLNEKGNFLVLDFSAKQYFKQVGNSFCIFLWQKQKKKIK